MKQSARRCHDDGIASSCARLADCDNFVTLCNTQRDRLCQREASDHNTAGTAKLKTRVNTGLSCPVAPIHANNAAIGRLPQLSESKNRPVGMRNIPAVTARASGKIGTARDSAMTQPPPRAHKAMPRVKSFSPRKRRAKASGNKRPTP